MVIAHFPRAGNASPQAIGTVRSAQIPPCRHGPGLLDEAGEATWRSGYAADCKSSNSASDFNACLNFPYQDKAEPNREHDTDAGGFAEREVNYARRADPTEIKIRKMRATAFVFAARDCHPDDARQLATGLLIDLSAGMPSEHVFGTVREDARWWGRRATPVELSEVLYTTLENLRNRALHRNMRKKLFFHLWRSFDKDDRERFLSFVATEQRS